MNKDRYKQLKQAELGAIISIVAYIVVSILKLTIGNLANSEALRADGLNNFTDILASGCCIDWFENLTQTCGH